MNQSTKQIVDNEINIEKIVNEQSRNTQQSSQQQKQLLNQDPKFIQTVIKIQKNIRASVIRTKLKQQFKRIHRRKRIIKQLVDTEENYIRDLGFIVSDFKMRMQSRGILTEEQGRKLFANVDEIRKLHDIFFSTIYNHFVNFHPYLIIFADVLNNIPYFRIYIDYLNNFPYACDLVNQYKKSKPAFASFVNQIGKTHLYNFLSLEDYMVKPVQRLPKYVLLLKQLLKNTQSTHPDFHNVRKALDKFSQVNSNNNQKLNKIRNSFKLRQLQSLLKLPQGIITPSSQFILQQTVQILNQQNDIMGNCVVYLLNNFIIITKRCGALLNRQTHFNSTATSHSARISQMYGLANSTMKQKLQVIVPLKYGTSVKLNKDQCFFKNSFIVQSPEGQSCTFICTTQDELHNLYNKIKKQSEIVVEQTVAKLKSMFQNDNLSHNNTFIKGISMLDLVPEVNVLGTSQRTDKMLKYTVYIVQVKVKMIKQKIFLRFSELLQLQRFINQQYRDKISIKQGLVNSSWLNNHHQKTIQQRKMNIQRFLKEILSKPEVIQNGWRILLRLGLPGDFYELPQKILQNKNVQSFVRKSTVMGKSIVKKKNKNNKNTQHYRLSIFQQQKIEQIQEQNNEDDDFNPKQAVQQSFQHTDPKSSYGSSNFSQKYLCIQDILKANQIDLGHYTRMESLDLSQNGSLVQAQFNNTMVQLEILMPCIETLYFFKKDQSNQINVKHPGFRSIFLKCSKVQRIQNIIPLVAKQINIRYYKDFRLLIQKQYSQRVLDDDQLVHKVTGQINRTNSTIVLRKIIYIDHQIQQKQLAKDRQRLALLASQVINEIKMGKYRLNYESYLKFSVLSTIVHQQSQSIKQNLSEATLASYAKEAKYVIFPKYSSLSQTQEIWIKDFIKAYNIIINKLKQVIKSNFEQVQKQKQQNMVEFHQESSQVTSNSFYWINTKLRYLTLLSIVKQIQKNQIIFGSVQFPVQISQQFKKYLQTDASSDIENLQSISQGQPKITYTSSQVSQNGKQMRSSRKLNDQQNKNCWFAIKHDKVIFTSITKTLILLQLGYQNLSKIQTYASAVVLQIKNMSINKIKLKTTSSYYIREMLVYYKNYRSVLKKICTDSQLKDSIIEMARDQLGIHPHQDMDQQYV